MPTSVAHVPMVCLPREVELLIVRAAGAWRQALECECRGDANAAVAWHLQARDLGERAERLARVGHGTAHPSAAVPPVTPFASTVAAAYGGSPHGGATRL